MKAIMRDNLVARYKAVMPNEYDSEIGEFLRSIEGKEVELRFIGTDAFEVKDNSIWLPDCLWDECTSNASHHAEATADSVHGNVGNTVDRVPEADRKMIFHVCRKLAVVLGLNTQEQAWLESLGATFPTANVGADRT